MHRRRFVMSTATRIDELSTLPGGAQTEPALQVERPPVDLSAGATLGSKYILQRELGRGGVGAVFAAENTWTGRCVAIKVLQPEYASVTTVVSRFWREARVASKLRHPNIVDVLDMGLDERSGAPFIVEELLDGEGYDVALDRAPGGRVAIAFCRSKPASGRGGRGAASRLAGSSVAKIRASRRRRDRRSESATFTVSG